MLAVRLPEDIEQRLAYLAKQTGRSKSYYVREALLGYLEDLEDIYLADKAVEDLRAGRSKTHTLEEVALEFDLED